VPNLLPFSFKRSSFAQKRRRDAKKKKAKKQTSNKNQVDDMSYKKKRLATMGLQTESAGDLLLFTVIS